MANSVTNTVLDKLVSETKDLNSKKDEAKQKAKLEKKLETLILERADLNPQDAEGLRHEAAALNRMADYTKHLADQLEKNEKNLDKKELKEIKQVLMEKLGVPAEFVDQLSILVKAGPEALREASLVYKKEADSKRDQAALMTQEIERLDSQIKQISHVKENIRVSSGSRKESMKDFLNRKLYEDSVRDDAEIELKQALELLEGGEGKNMANHV